MRARQLGLTPFLLLATLLVIPVPRVAAQSPPAAVTTSPSTDLDALMARVLANRDQTWRSLQEYLLAERETFKLVGPDGAPMFGLQKEFMWVAREGRAVRSPVRVNGVAIGEETRRREEAEWQADEDRRAERASEKAQSETATTAEVEQAMRRGEPRFISEVQFLRFRFEPGNYYFVGRETLAGREVLRMEYYPRRLFADDREERRAERERAKKDEAAGGRKGRTVDLDEDDRLERAINKVSLVTLWVDATVSQIVRYTFDNVDFNFLPGRSLVRVDTATATMTMGQPFPGIWLPESLTVEGALTLATGTYRAEYARRFSDYRQGDVQMRFRVKDEPK
ncbi:hypothetical protein LuPra_00306 [Luteitalea pratensis]|uniref:Uncharacterized protein n=1 Tax=Luteitalea pratensis TaxID=1855912 RepID=A0A143PHA5_LUTPR|nr:hypothetical protein [Luteitalea pratensis]AMY07139.1 hypothetical protein LuPra_00306 [Luteitalea pratensis]